VVTHAVVVVVAALDGANPSSETDSTVIKKLAILYRVLKFMVFSDILSLPFWL
jgi:hypothetical protein